VASQNNSGPGFLAGLLLGGIIGAILGLLLAPRPGEQMRQELRERGLDLAERAKGTIEELSQKAKVVSEDAVAQAKAAIEEGRELLREAVEEGKEAASRVGTELRAKFEAAKEGKEEGP